jgi:hypothetical protein
MRQETLINHSNNPFWQKRPMDRARRSGILDGRLLQPVERGLPRQTTIGLILVLALLAFEIFNFDTTRFALANLLGEASFMGLRWATILAIAFCAIDFAGLAYILTPGRPQAGQNEVWYLMGAWLLGATMNALMTWWAVSLTLLDHNLGNEVLAREQLLEVVPIYVAVLVWLTRILFIGAFSVAGNSIFGASMRRQARANEALRRGVVGAGDRPAAAGNAADDSGRAGRRDQEYEGDRRAYYGPPQPTFRRQPVMASARSRRR